MPGSGADAPSPRRMAATSTYMSFLLVISNPLNGADCDADALLALAGAITPGGPFSSRSGEMVGKFLLTGCLRQVATLNQSAVWRIARQATPQPRRGGT